MGKGKSFQCEKCQKYFKAKYNLDLHIKGIHEKIQDHVCNICGLGFSKIESLKKHTALAHEKVRDNFQCLICQKVLTTKGNFQKPQTSCP